MKNVMLALAVVGSLLSANAKADVVEGYHARIQNYSIEKMDIDSNSILLNQGASRYTGGSVKVDLTRKTMKIQINRRNYCPPGMFCTMMMPLPVVIELPVISVVHGFAGGTIITAQVDNSKADGMKITAVLYDDSTSVTTDVKMYDTQLELSEFAPFTSNGQIEAHSAFQGRRIRYEQVQ